MSNSLRLVGALALVPLVACATPDFHARPVGAPIAVRTGSELVAEGRMQVANGNFGLAIDAFRRAMRQDPQSLEAFDGLASAYDRLGRFDLAQRYYEEALAFAPADPMLQAHYAASLRAHGLIEAAEQLEALAAATQLAPAPETATALDEVAAVDPQSVAPLPSRVEMAVPPPSPVQAPAMEPAVPATPAPAPVLAAAPAPAPAPVPALVAPIVAAPAFVAPPRAAVAPVVANSQERQAGPRLERLSSGEVLLVTRSEGPSSAMRRAEAPARPVVTTPVSGANGFRRAEAAAPRAPVIADIARNAAQGVAAVAAARVNPIVGGRPAVVALVTPARILNAVGRRGQASRMEVHLRTLGWQQTSIGDSRLRRNASVILTPASTLRQATALATSLPFRPRVVRSSRVRQVVLVLGSDAVSFDRQLVSGPRST